MQKKTENVIIIGSGPAGFSAAIYTARAGLEPLLFEGLVSGGQLTMTSEVENYPGYPNGVLGINMMEDFKNQALRFNTRIISTEINKLKCEENPFSVTDSNGDIYFSKSIIIATGSSAKWLNTEDEKKYIGKGISSCATCDGFFYKNEIVGVVGGGDTAAEEALYLSKITSQVNLFVRGDRMRASKIMQDRIFKNTKIKIYFNTIIKKMLGKNKLESVIIEDKITSIQAIVNISGLFIAIGHKPNTEIFEGKISLDERKYIKTIPGTTKTNIPGIFAAGDVQDPHYRQAVTAAGSGCMAALDVEKYL